MWNSENWSAPEASAEESQCDAPVDEMPLVYLCSGCRRPLGDSLSSVSSKEETDSILLRDVSSYVSVDKEQNVSEHKKENGCVLETLYCKGCSLQLGYKYSCTPKNLNFKKNLFCLSAGAIDKYILGSSEKRIVSEDNELFNLESRVEMEKCLKQMEDVLHALQMQLKDVESKVLSDKS